jgi:hypothetical protein
MKVSKLENNVYHTQYILDDGSSILLSDKYGKVYMQHGRCVPNKNHRVIYYMNQELNSFLKKQEI